VRSFSEKETVNFKFLNISRENACCNVKLLVRGTLLCYAEIRKTDDLVRMRSGRGDIKMMKQKAYPGSLYDLRGVEKWLEDLSAHGLRLEEFSNLGKLAKLEKAPLSRRRYYLEPDFDQYGSDEAKKVYMEQGWRYVCEVSGVFLVYESEDPWVQKPQRRQADEKKLRKKWRNLWLDLILWVVGLGLAGWQAIEYMDLLDRYDASYYDLLTGAGLMLIPVSVVFLLELWMGFTKSYDLHIWRMCVRRGETAEPWQGMKAIRWVDYCILPIILAIMILLVLVANGFDSRKYVPVWRQDRVLPMVTLDVTEDVIHYAPEPYGPSINVSFRRRMLIPQDIHIDSMGLFENPGDVDAWVEREHFRDPDAEMRFAYYRLWTEGMAVKLAESEAFQWEIERNSHEQFDELWLGSNKFGSTFLVAREGDVVITVTYQGGSTLEAHLDEIYEIVTDYRNG